MVVLGGGGVIEGEVGGTSIRIYDANLDGQFRGDGDAIAVGGEGTRDNSRMPWSRVMEIGGRLQTVALDAERLKLTPYAGEIAEVRVRVEPPPKHMGLQFREMGGAMMATARDTEAVRLVPGRYRIYGSLGFGDKDKSSELYLRALPAPVVVRAGPQEIKLGPPLRVDFEATRDGDTVTIGTVPVTGSPARPTSRGSTPRRATRSSPWPGPAARKPSWPTWSMAEAAWSGARVESQTRWPRTPKPRLSCA